MQFSHVGEFASSKSAMNTLAPELSALITILRSTGPVISTRRSAISSGNGAIRQSPSRTSRGLREEVGQLARREPRRALGPSREQLAPALAELALEVGQELDRLRREDVVDLHRVILSRSTLASAGSAFVAVVALAVLGAGALGGLGAREDRRRAGAGVLAERGGFTGFSRSASRSCGAPLCLELLSSVEPLSASVDEARR